jgi:hypothetical protein
LTATGAVAGSTLAGSGTHRVNPAFVDPPAHVDRLEPDEMTDLHVSIPPLGDEPLNVRLEPPRLRATESISSNWPTDYDSSTLRPDTPKRLVGSLDFAVRDSVVMLAYSWSDRHSRNKNAETSGARRAIANGADERYSGRFDLRQRRFSSHTPPTDTGK